MDAGCPSAFVARQAHRVIQTCGTSPCGSLGTTAIAVLSGLAGSAAKIASGGEGMEESWVTLPPTPGGLLCSSVSCTTTTGMGEEGGCSCTCRNVRRQDLFMQEVTEDLCTDTAQMYVSCMSNHNTWTTSMIIKGQY